MKTEALNTVRPDTYWLDNVEQATAEYVTLERVLALPVAERTRSVWGVMAWAARFSPDALDALRDDYRHALVRALNASNARALTREIAGWKAAARSL